MDKREELERARHKEKAGKDRDRGCRGDLRENRKRVWEQNKEREPEIKESIIEGI